MSEGTEQPDGGEAPAAFGPAAEYLRHGEAVHESGWQLEMPPAVTEADPAGSAEDAGAGTSHRGPLAPPGTIAREARVLDRLRARRAERPGGDR